MAGSQITKSILDECSILIQKVATCLTTPGAISKSDSVQATNEIDDLIIFINDMKEKFAVKKLWDNLPNLLLTFPDSNNKWNEKEINKESSKLSKDSENTKSKKPERGETFKITQNNAPVYCGGFNLIHDAPNEVAKKKQKILDQKKVIKNLEVECANLKHQMAIDSAKSQCDPTLSWDNVTVDDLHKKLNEKDKLIEELTSDYDSVNGKNKKLSGDMEQMNETNAEKDKGIDKLTKEVSMLKEENQNLLEDGTKSDGQIKLLNSEIKELKKKNADLNSEINTYKNNIAEQSGLIEKLKSQILEMKEPTVGLGETIESSS